MDVAEAIAKRVKQQEAKGYLPLTEEIFRELALKYSTGEWELPPPGGKYFVLPRSVTRTAAFMLYEYFDGTLFEDKDDQDRKMWPYTDHVLAAWQKHPNAGKSIRLLAILFCEYEALLVYWPEPIFPYILKAAQHLGIEDDWPELLPARPEMRPQEPEPQPEYPPSNQRPYSSDPYPAGTAAKVGQMQNELLRTMGQGGWAQGGMWIPPGGGIHTNPYG